MSVDSSTSTSITVSWTSSGSEGVSYKVYWQRDGLTDQSTTTIPGASTSYAISGLGENSRYTISVTATNAVGSEESESVIGMTESQDTNTPGESYMGSKVSSTDFGIPYPQW